MGLSPKRRAAAVVTALALAGLGAGAATACDHGGRSGVAAAQHSLTRHHHRGLLGVASTYLGLSRAQIRDRLRAGQSLAEIANATPGKSAAGLVDAVTAAVKTKLDRAVAAGKLTAAQASTLLAKANDWVTRLVNRTWTAEHHSRR